MKPKDLKSNLQEAEEAYFTNGSQEAKMNMELFQALTDYAKISRDLAEELLRDAQQVENGFHPWAPLRSSRVQELHDLIQTIRTLQRFSPRKEG